MLASLIALTLTAAPQQPVSLHEDLQYSEAARQQRRNRLDLYVPEVAAPPPLVMFVHGGSWTGGSKDHFGRVGEILSAEGFACAVVNTRLFPFAKPDAMVVDCAHALGFLHRHGEDYGYDGDQLFVMGHSSGAHLCSWLALDERKLAVARVPRSALRGAVLLSGVYDVRGHHILLDGVFGRDQELRRAASTWFYAGEGDCPTYIAWAEREIAGISLCGKLLRDELRRCGVPVQTSYYAGRSHANYMFQLGTRRDLVTAPVVAFLKNPTAAQPARAQGRQAVLWIAADEREERLGEAVSGVCLSEGVDVVVRRIPAPDGSGVASVYRRVRSAREEAGRSPLRFIAGFGQGGLAVAACPLTPETDRLRGRFVAGAPLGTSWSQLAPFRLLSKAPLLCLCGDEDSPSVRQGARRLGVALGQAGCDVSPCELMNTTAEAALAALDGDDDLVRPMLLTFFGARR